VRIESGVEAHAALQALRANPADAAAQARFAAHQADLGYGLLLLRYVSDPSDATSGQLEQAAWSTVPNVPVLFWSFRVMVGLGLFFILLFATAFYLSARHRFEQNRWFLRIAFLSLPLPWIAAELGWIVAEYGRQPWLIDGLLPTFLGVSVTRPATSGYRCPVSWFFTLRWRSWTCTCWCALIRRGPDGLGYWPPERTPVGAQ